jgi:hypothetical protein
VVTFINTNGMAFIGPGSEWFWAALQFTALTITFIAIYRQLRIARSTRAVEQVDGYSRQLDSERMARCQLAILVAHRDSLEIPNGASRTVANYFEGLGSLSRSGHLDVKVLWSLVGGMARLWWIVLEPFVQRLRAELGESAFEEFEWLVGMFAKLDRRAGRFFAYDAAWVATWLAAGAIEGLQDRIRIDEALRTVAIAPSHGPDTAQSAGTASAPAPSRSLTADNEQEHQSD